MKEIYEAYQKNPTETAKMLGISRPTLLSRFRKAGFEIRKQGRPIKKIEMVMAEKTVDDIF